MSRLYVRLTPKSSRDAVEGWGEDEHGRAVLKVRVRAAPIEGRANESLIALLAKTLNVPKSSVRLIGGDTSRIKSLEIEGIDEPELKSRLVGFMPGSGISGGR